MEFAKHLAAHIQLRFTVLIANMCCVGSTENPNADSRLNSAARVPDFLDLASKSKPFFIMLQEVRACFYKQTDTGFEYMLDGNMIPIIAGLTKLGYDYAMPSVKGHPSGSYPFYNPIFYRRDVFEVVTDPRTVYYECSDSRKWYYFVVQLRHLGSGMTITLINTHFPMGQSDRMVCATQFNRAMHLASASADYVVGGGDTNIFPDAGGPEQEAVMASGLLYVSQQLLVNVAAENELFGTNYHTVDEAAEPVGTFVGYDYDRVKPLHDQVRIAGSATDDVTYSAKLDSAFAVSANPRMIASAMPITFPFRHVLSSDHLSGVMRLARSYPGDLSLKPGYSDHLPMLVTIQM